MGLEDKFAPSFAKKPAIRQEEDGSRLMFECKIKSNPKPVVTWEHDGNTIHAVGRLKAKLQLDSADMYHSSMEITDVTLDDAGKYKVIAKNDLGECSASISLNFDSDEAPLPPDGTKPNFTEKPVIRQSDDGTKIIFECRLIADPTPTIEWFFKEKVVKEDSRHQSFLRSDKHTHLASLEILSVAAADAGEYKLVAKNTRGQSFATLNLNYDAGKAKVPSGKAPRFPKKPAIKQVGANLLLECVLEAQPLGTITWFHGSKVVQESSKRKISRKELSKDTYLLSLQIDDPEAVDGGNYRCNAVNDFGESNANIALNFQEEEEEEELSEEEDSSISEKAKRQAEEVRKRQEQRQAEEQQNKQQEKKQQETTVDKKKLESKAEKKTETRTETKTETKTEAKEEKKAGAKVEEKKVAVKVEAEATKKVPAKVQEKAEAAAVSKQQSVEVSSSGKSTSASAEATAAATKTTTAAAATTKTATTAAAAAATKTTTAAEAASAKTTATVAAVKTEEQKAEATKTVEQVKKTAEKKEVKQVAATAAAKQADESAKVTETKSAAKTAATTTATSTTTSTSAKLGEQKSEGKEGRKDSVEVRSAAEEKAEVKKSSLQKAALLQRDESRGSLDEPEPPASLDKKASLVPQIQVEKDKSPSPGEAKRGSSGKVPLLNEPDSRRGSFEPGGSRRGSFLLDGGKEGVELLGAQLKKAPSRRGSEARRGSTTEDDPAEKPSVPLKACPGPGPKIVDFQVNQSATEGKTAVIVFSITGDPIPTFQYFKDDTEIFEGGRYKVVTDGSAKNVISFCIRKSKVNDEGKYKFVAKNQHGQDTAEIALFVGGEEGMDFRALLKKGKKAVKKKEEGPDFGTLKSTESERKASIKEVKKPDIFLKPLQNQKVKEGRDKKVRFECVFSKNNIKAKWFKNKQELFVGKKYKMTSQGDLHILEITDPKVEDEAKYVCQCLDTKTEGYLEVEPADPVYKFTKKLDKTSNGYSTRETVLECQTNSSKAPVKWYKDEEPLSSGKKFLIEEDKSGKKTLRILDSAKDVDNGNYSCRIINTEEVTVTKVTIIDQTFKFIRMLKSLRVQETEPVTLECELDDGDGIVTWFKDGKELTAADKHFQISADGRKRRLGIKKSKMSDEGKYLCKVQGDETECEVIVNRKATKPAKPKGPLKVTEVHAEGCKLKWEKPDDDGGDPIKHYVVEKMDVDTGTWVPVTTSKEPECEVTELVTGKKYKFRVKAVNAEGESEPLETDQETLAKNPYDAPDKPRKLAITSTEKRHVELKWEAPASDGGAPITGYVVEKKDSTGKWVKCVDVPAGQTKARVGDLVEGTQYEFRVRAVNKAGPGEPSDSVEKRATPPGPPGVPTCADQTPDSITLKWTAPADDGGAPITGYIIEKKVANENKWTKVPYNVTETNFKVGALVQDQKYVFRIAAVNAAGTGPWSAASDQITAQFPPSAPKIDPNFKLKDITVVAGEKFTLQVPFAGTPRPTAEWRVNDGIIKPDGTRITSEVNPEFAVFRNLSAKRNDSGTYQLKLTNSEGSDTCSCQVTVIDKPGSPQGPLEVTDVYKEGCTLKWDKVKDDGGTPIEEYVIEKMDVTSGRWVPCGKSTEPQFNVKGLVPGQKYKFRVKAVNKVGESTPLEADKIITAKNPYDEPGRPGIPEIVDYDNKSVDLKWPPPASDGGTPITNYIVEAKEAGSTVWKEVGASQGGSPKAKIHGLKEGTVLEFRVKAVNSEGVSKPSDASSPHTVKHRNLKPLIDRTNLNPTILKVGRGINIEVDVRGEPPPKIEWFFNGKPVKNDGNLMVNSIDYHTTFTLEKAKRVYSGPYTIVATNASGKDEAVVDVTVLGRPSRPNGPLEVSDVHKEGCTLKWQAPDDDGGCPIECYEIEKLDEKTGLWVPAGKSTEPKFNVKNLVPGHKYKFRVRAVNKEGDSEELETDMAIIAKNPHDEPGKPGRPVATDWDKDHVDLKWTAPASDGGTPITGYVIEKRKKGQHRWQKGKEVKGDVTEATVPGLDEGEEYEFRVVAVNSEGPGEPSDPSATVITKPRKLAPIIDKRFLKNITVRSGQPVKFDADVQGEPPPTITWTFKEKPVVTSDTVSVTSETYHTTLMLSKTKRAQSGLYTLTATNIHGKDEAQIDITVLAKPSKPNGPLEVSDVHAEGCKLKWDKPEDDGGEPIKHYVVEKMDMDTGLWVPVTTTKDPECEIIGLVPGKKYKFRVKAVNSEGDSEPLETEKATLAKNPFDEPDKPGKLAIVNADKRHVELKWEAPANDGGSPVTGYIVEKKDAAIGKWVKCLDIPGDETQARVGDLIDGSQYQFRVKAVNKAGPGKPSDTVEVKAAPPGPPGVPTCADQTPDSITLKWTAPANDGGSPVTGYVIEKQAVGENKWTRVPHTVPDTTFKVPALVPNQKYVFRIAAVNAAGTGPWSAASDQITAQYPPSAPKIDPSFRLKDITVVAGDKFSLQVPFSGSPVPKAEWTVNDAVVKPDGERITTEVHGDFTLFRNTNAKRSDSGTYQLKLTNSEGSDTCSCQVTVIDKPGSPQGPLEVTDVYKEGCTLKWKEVKDDGGTPIEEYVIEKMDVDRGIWVPCGKSVDPSFNVKGLVPGQKYKFRVKAVNKVGESAPLEAEKVITAKNPFEEPGRPGIPEVVDYDNKSAELMWSPPAHDGGTPIKNYIVEAKEVGSTVWNEVGASQGSSPKAKIHGLKEGAVMEFRVKAVNSEGVSKPSDASSPHTVKHRNLKPLIDRTNLNPTILKVGRGINIEVDVRGEPPPKIEWFFNGKPVKNDGNLMVNSIDYHTTFTLAKAKRAYSGPYTIVATNANGKDEAVIDLTVLGKPTRPRGPLEVSDVHKEGCTLKWQAPDDDGGCPIECYEIEKLDEETGLWVPAGKSTEPKFNVKNLVPGHKYKFRVRAVNKEGDSEELETDMAIIAKNPHDEPGKPGRPVATDWDKDHVDLKWTAPASDGGTPITGYVIEKRKKGQHRWQKGKEVKGDVTEATVPGLDEGEEYEFRVVAVNSEGPGEPSDPSATVITKPRKLAPIIDKRFLKNITVRSGQPVKFDADVQGEPPPTITWTFKEKPVVTSDTVSVTSETYHTTLMLSKTKRAQSGLYTLTATNIHGKDEAQVDITVLAKPAKPKGPLEVSDVHAEGCKLKWDKPEDDGGEPIKHYVVEKMDMDTGLWVPVTTTKDPECEIIGLVPGKKYKFRVKAVNSEGDSEPLETEKATLAKNPFDEPDKPGKLAIVNADKRHVELKWEAPADDGGSPVTGYIVEKKDAAIGKWVKCLDIPGDETQARVGDLIDGSQYQFRVKAVNKAGPGKPSDTVEVKAAPPGPPGVPTCADQTPDSITLKWTAPANDGGSPVTGYVIEKQAVGENKWTRVPHTVPDTTFKVPALVPNQKYVFRIAAVNAAGTGPWSAASDQITAQYPPSAPKIDPSFRLKDITVVAGDKFSLQVPFSGSPVPKAEWTVNDAVVKPDGERITTEVHGDFTLFRNTNAKRSDSGTYQLKLTNSEGSDTCSCQVTVIDKPGSPQGPLEVTDVYKEGCTLKWKEVKDDGGTPIEEYVIEKMDVDRGIWVPCGKSVDPSFNVKGLVPGQKYKFRVKAVNKVGESAPLEAEKVITAKNPFEEPGRPGIPEVVDYDNKSAELMWSPPAHDGGTPIKNYIVEAKEVGSTVWNEVGASQGSSPKAKIHGLKEGAVMEFRVKAVNSEGVSKPSDASSPHTVKHRNLKPLIDRTNLNPTILKVGRGINIEVDVRGEPPPKIEWFFNGKPVKNDGNLMVNSIDYHTTFTLAKAKRAYSGPYTIVATNANGKDEAVIDLTVLGKPTRPRGPLEVSDVHKEGCTLKWQAPDDDGGCPIECYEIEKLDEETGLWVPAGKSTEPKFNVKNLVPGHKYKFRVRAVNKEGDSEELETDMAIIAKNPHDEPGKPGRPVATDWDKDHVDLKWTAPASDGGTPITGYVIEKRKKGQHRWQKGKEVKGDVTEATVPGLDEGEEYEFRVVAVNSEGPGEPSDPSATVITKPRKLAPIIDKRFLKNITVRSGQPVKFDADVQGEPPPTITWTFKEKPVVTSDTVSVTSETYHTTLMLSKTKRAQSGLYTLTATNIHGKDEAQVDITVLAKPAKPKGPLEVSDVHAEGCKLKWDKPEDDGGEPIKHYVVEKMDMDTGLWVPVTTTKDPECEIIGLVPGKKYKFRVKAVNSEGDSEPLETEKATLAKNPFDEPDKPGKLAIVNADKRHVELKWEAPADDGGSPVTGYIVEKKDAAIGKWVKCLDIPGDETQARVGDLIDGSQYQFRVKAVNKAGPGKPSDTVEVKAAPPGPPGVPTCADQTPDSITLKWTAPANDGGSPVTGYVIEKQAVGENKWTRVPHTVPDTTFKVPALVPNQKYVFRIAAVNAAGTGPWSAASDQITAQYPPSAPKIDPSFRLKDITVVAGDKFSLQVPFSGSPVPKAEWTVNDAVVKPDGERITTEVHGDFTLFRNTNAKRSDSGTYQLKLTNSEGSDTCSCQVTVIDKPGSPQGPLEVTDVYKEGCTLKWKEVKDDGGTPIEEYVIEKMDVDRGIWVPCGKSVDPSFNVKGLVPGQKYKFRVKAVNKVGESAPLEAEKVITAKNPFEEPGRPGIPEVVDYDNKSAELMWSPPAHDGGTPIKNYIVEAKEVGSTVWNEVGASQGSSPKAKIHGLKEGAVMEFRVKAVNSEGVSKPSDASSPHTVKHRNLKPLIDRTNLNPTILKVGRGINIEVDVRGEPPPKIEWFFNGKPVKNDGNLMVNSIDYHTTFTLEKAKRAYSGPYTIVATNANGKDEAVIDLTVLGRPSRPNGPIEVSDIHKEGCTLKWQAPDDDGGCPIECYEIEKLDEETGLWVPAGKSTEPKFNVKNLVPGHKYKFRVRAVNKEGDSEELETDMAIIAKNPHDEPGKPGRPVATDWDKDHVDLKWTAPASDGGTPITGYVIEKRKKGQHRWQKGKEVKGDVTEATVPGLDEGEEYEFRVVAVNSEGPGEPSDPSATVITKPRKLAPIIDKKSLQPVTIRVGQPVKFDVDVQGEPPPTITWTFQDKPVQNSDTTSIITNPNHTIFMLVKTKRPQSGVYKITATNAHGTDVAEVEIKVVGRPAAPKGPLEVSDVFAEGCKLKWQPPEDDGGEPIKHYVVEKMDMDTGMWIPVMTTKDPEAEVTGLVPGKMYKFRVKAVNNEGESDPLEAAKAILAKNPFDEPGKPAKLAIVSADKRHVDLKWEPPATDGGSPITGYIVEKKDFTTGKWVQCDELPAETTEVRVYDLIEGNNYEFRVKAVNRAGAGKPSDVAELKPSPPGPPGTPQCVTSAPDSITLTWTEPKNNGGAPIRGYIIEKRVVGDNKWVRVPYTVNDTTFKVPALVADQIYEFRVAAVNAAGTGQFSAASDAIRAQGPPSAPKIDPSFRLKDITVVAGEKFSLHVPFSGSPTPKAEWSVNGEIQKPNDRTNSEVNAEFTIYRNSKAKRSDSGTYKLKLVNSEGSDTCSCQVTVIDKPGPPQGPLEIGDINKEGCTLKWKEVKDDGGTAVEEYVIEKMDVDSGIWLPCGRSVDTRFHVRGLATGQKYKFRVKAVNKVGESSPLEADKIVTAKNPFEVPGRPGIPEVIDYDNKSVELKWSPPASDGGTPISHYIVEAKEAGSTMWNEVSLSSSSNPRAKVHGLKEGKVLEFRVRAVNAEGTGQPGDASSPHTVKHKNLAPHIDRTNLIHKTCKVGRGINLEVDVRGEPPPKIEWFLNKKPVKNDGNCTASSIDYHTTFTIEKAKREYSGTYTIVATNANGRDEAAVEITVQSRPSQPRGPLEVSDVHKEGCTLKWLPPDDDGGCPLECYEIEKMDEETGEWIHCGRSFDTRFNVKNLIPLHKYKFRVRAVNKEGDSDELVGDKFTLMKSQFDSPDKPGRPVAVDWDKTHVDLKWTAPLSDGGTAITGYIIEKKKKGSRKWLKGNEVKGNICEGSVSGLEEGEEYEFRVKAINREGPGEPSDPSIAVLCRSRKPAATVDDINMHRRKPVLKVQKSMDTQKEVPEEQKRKKREFAPFKQPEQPDCAPIFTFLLRPRVIQLREPVKLLACVKAKPYADIKWYKNKQELSKEAYAQTHEDGVVTLDIASCDFSDAGKYSCRATNALGEDETWCHVTLEDRKTIRPGSPTTPAIGEVFRAVSHPPPPALRSMRASSEARQMTSFKDYTNHEIRRGTLTISDINKESCTLKWKEVKNESTVIEEYVIEKLDVDSGIWSACGKSVDTRFHVRGLVTGQKYKFRVMAVSKGGGSSTLESDRIVTAKNPFEVPGIPGIPEVIDYDNKSVELKWSPPASDGGTPISHYIVEAKETSSMVWSEVSMSSSSNPRAKVHGLREGKILEFRVRAVNAEGTGQPGDASSPHTVKHKNLAPHIDRTNLIHKTCKVGRGINLEVDVRGEPPPKIEWFLNKKPVKNDGNCTASSIDYHTTFTIEKAKREYSGTYTIVATNANGRDEAAVEITVQSRPSQPRGPLEVSDVHKEGCTLKWLPPDDDGGCPLECYEIEKMDEETGEWIHCGRSFDTRFNVKNLIPLHKYKFRVRAVNKEGDSDELVGDKFTLMKSQFDSPDKPGRPVTVNWDKTYVDLKWTAPLSDGGSLITGYVIEKKKRSHRKWLKGKEVKGNICEASVSGLEEGEEYEFRVMAINREGPGEPSDPSIAGLCRSRKPAATVDDIYVHRQRTVLLSVQQKSMDMERGVLEEPKRKKRDYTPFRPPEQPDCAPIFTFLLRPRVIQLREPVKLLACVKAKPYAEIRWYKNKQELSKEDYAQTHEDGVVTLDIASCDFSDAGKYSCRATNALGEDETWCHVTLEDRKTIRPGSPTTPVIGEVFRAVSQPPPPALRSIRATSEARQMTSFKEYTNHEVRRRGLHRKETTEISVQSSSTRHLSTSSLSLNRDSSL